jgi:DNA polymerase III subunit alpha
MASRANSADTGVETEKLLWSWLREGWRYRKLGKRPNEEQEWYAERIKYEMGLFLSKDLADFLLFTSDAIRWAKDNGVAIGPGRGSSAASVCCWVLRITEMDPIKYPLLLFERFLDVTRMDPPDIDVDCSDDDRWRLWEYLEGKYGQDRVGKIANFVRYRGKNSLADVSRVYRVPKAAKEIVSNLIIERSGGDSRFDATLEDTVNMFPNAKAIFDKFPDLWKAARFEGNVRGMSVHAAGLIVANSPLTDICAVYEKDGVRCLSIDKYDCEYIDAVKLDFLGLSTMGMISTCLKLAGLTLGDLYAIPDDDPEALDVFRRGDVTGIFQFEGRATRIINRDVIPDSFLEVCDINALSRPGPLFSGTTADYTEVKHGRKAPEKYHPIVDNITEQTKGCIIYQEQILQICREVGGFPWTDANDIRRIISKKIGQAAFEVRKEQFQREADHLHGMDYKTSDRIWKRLVTSGTYAFVYAHSLAYVKLSWWCAWLKAYYPAEFYAACLTKADPNDSYYQFRLMRDAESHGQVISGPVLNWSGKSWSIHPSSGLIVAGWEAIPGIGEKTAENIISDREENGRFSSWLDLTRVPGIGPKTATMAEAFATSHDPFQIHRAERLIESTLAAIEAGDIRVPKPNYDGAALARISESSGPAKRGERRRKPTEVVWIGIVRERLYQNAVENERSRSGEEVDDILAKMKQPELQDYCTLRCFDNSDEDVYIRTTRFSFPKFRRKLETIDVGTDLVVVKGKKSPGFGTSVYVDDIWVISPD